MIRFPRHPADLSKRAVEVLRWLGSEPSGDDDYPRELAAEGLEVWFGLERTNQRIVSQLLECCFISPISGPGDRMQVYVINGSGERFLKGLPPYHDADGNEHETLFSLLK